MARRTRFRFILILLAGGIIVIGLLDERRQREEFFRQQSRQEPYGVQANEQRSQWHVPVIPAHWTTRETSVIWKGAFHFGRTIPNYWQTQQWQDRDEITEKNGHRRKVIHRFSDDAREESDEFYYSVSDARYQLRIVSTFRSPDTVMSASYLMQVSPVAHDSLLITLHQRDSILQCCAHQ